MIQIRKPDHSEHILGLLFDGSDAFAVNKISFGYKVRAWAEEGDEDEAFSSGCSRGIRDRRGRDGFRTHWFLHAFFSLLTIFQMSNFSSQMIIIKCCDDLPQGFKFAITMFGSSMLCSWSKQVWERWARFGSLCQRNVIFTMLASCMMTSSQKDQTVIQ